MLKSHLMMLRAAVLALCAGCFLLLAESKSFAQEKPQSVLTTSWPATDALGRQLPLSDEVGPPRRDHFVGIFYFLWHNDRQTKGDGPRDISKILAEDPQALKHPDSPLWGPFGSPHYWGQPLFGYYLSTDPWVLRRHARLLADAGIDTLIFDATNAQTYPKVYTALCETFTAIRKEGGRTPQICFMVNTNAQQTAQQLYHELYRPGRYQNLWFIWQGKPLLICDPAVADQQLKSFFTLRAAHWPFTLVNTPYAWHWESAYPQVYGYTDDPNKPEQVNVAVAQNLRARDAKVTNMSAGNARGRSFHDGKEDRSPGAVNWGYNFGEQWKRALELKPPFVMVTGWNEWIAGKFGQPHKSVAFVDQFDEEFSRDIEPMKGGHGDNYYYQLVANVRRFKGAPPVPQASAMKKIDLTSSFDAWKDVQPEYTTDPGATLPRDFPGVAGLHYENHSGRNEFQVMKVARDAQNVHFYARTAKPISSPTDANWMWLLIAADQNSKTGWEGYDFILNRTMDADHTSWLEKNVGGWKWEKVAKVHYRVEGNELELSIPRSALGLSTGATALSFDFKWADNLQHPGDIMDFYSSGDVAPDGRFNYRYSAK